MKSLTFTLEKLNFCLLLKSQLIYGSLDLCLIVDDDLNQVKKDIEDKEYPIELEPVVRHGALGEMKSIYLRDPDGNLIELSNYNN